MERESEGGQPVSEGAHDAAKAALEKAGAEFIPENGGVARVRLAKRTKKKDADAVTPGVGLSP